MSIFQCSQLKGVKKNLFVNLTLIEKKKKKQLISFMILTEPLPLSVNTIT